MSIRKAVKNDKDNCLGIADNLKAWFEKETLDEMAIKILEYSTFVYEEAGKMKGFITLRDYNTDVVEIVWIAVEKDSHRKGIGTEILQYTVKNIKNKKIFKVKTLDESEKYKPYEATRKFYEKNGFSKVAAIDPYPGWEPGNPCAIYVKAIG